MICYTILLQMLAAHWAVARDFPTDIEIPKDLPPWVNLSRTMVTPYPESQAEMVDLLYYWGHLVSKNIGKILLQVDRKYYIHHSSYEDYPLGIVLGATINSPPLHAYFLEVLEHHLTEGSRVLDIGTGSGYLAVCMALMVGKTGMVLSMEHFRELINYATNNINSDKPELLKNQLRIIEGDGRLGCPEHGPYDVINVGAAVKEIPQILVQQLKLGGRMVMPINYLGNRQQIVIVDKRRDGKVVHKLIRGILHRSYIENLQSRKEQWPLNEKEQLLVDEIMQRQNPELVNKTLYTY